MNPSFGIGAPEGSPQFKTPQEEIAYLRAKVAEREGKSLAGEQGSNSREQGIREEVNAYKALPHEVVAEDYRLTADHIEREVLHMSAAHEEKIDQLIEIMREKGLKNALIVAEKSGNSHLEDDFHRFLVQYLAGGNEVSGLERGGRMYGSLKMRLYEVTLPEIGSTEQDKNKTFADLVAKMEQFYAGMLSLGKEGGKTPDLGHFTIEIALSNYSEEIVLYVAVPIERGDLFEKHIEAIYSQVKLRVHDEDYNPFEDDGVTAGSVAYLAEEDILPLKTYDTFQHDPLQVLLSVFSKMKREGEGAAVQLVIAPVSHEHNIRYRRTLERLKKGMSLGEALQGELTEIAKGFADSAKEIFFGVTESHEKKEKKRAERKELNARVIELVEKKLSAPIVDTNIRLITSAGTQPRAEALLLELESAFQQFGDSQANRISFKRTQGAQKTNLIREFIFRTYAPEEASELNIKELTTLFHFPVTELKASHLKQATGGGAPAPLGLDEQGVVVGINRYHAQETKITMRNEDRMRHLYVIGQTGTGKTTLLKNIIIQDIMRGEGVCFIDPHGTDIEDILANIPRERVDDVIYFDPAMMARPMGLNMLEYDTRFPEQKTFVVNELLAIFNKLFDMKTAGGPAFEQYFRNSALLVMEDPASGNTLLEVGRVLADKTFRDLKLSRCKNPIIRQFWENAEKTTGDQGLANYVPYVTNKFDVFVSNDIMRPIIAQEQSAFNFRDIMDTRKIFLVNLSKGRLGDINSNLIGLILVGKFLMAALSRVDVLSKGAPPDFFLFIDEFQNVTTDSIAQILSEARKYRLSLTVAHQYISQLDEKIKDAVFGNVGSMAAFRVGAEDAEILEPQFAPTFSRQDIIRLENRNAYMKMLVNGSPARPFNIQTLPPPQGNHAIGEKLKELSALTYGRPREEIEAEIMKRYR